VVTVHRRENFGERVAAICRALRRLVERFRDLELAIPVHPNPQVQAAVRGALSEVPRVRLLEPLPYPDMLWLLKRAHLIVTDSGGLQEEAPALRKPLLFLRERTERPEGLNAGCARLVGTTEQGVFDGVSRLLENEAEYQQMAQAPNPYGDGHAAEAIVDHLQGRLR
jgi:UDP-N-acetylglucosamine 2-epimerase (non-hydrolysing)